MDTVAATTGNQVRLIGLSFSIADGSRRIKRGFVRREGSTRPSIALLGSGRALPTRIERAHPAGAAFQVILVEASWPGYGLAGRQNSIRWNALTPTRSGMIVAAALSARLARIAVVSQKRSPLPERMKRADSG